MLPLTATDLGFLTHLPRSSTPRSSLQQCPVQISHGGSQGFKSPHLHPQHRRSECRQRRAGDAHCMLRPRCGRKLKSQPSREGAQRSGDSTRAACRRRRTSLRARLLTDERSSRAGVYCRPRGRPGHCPTTSHDDGQVQTEHLCWPSTACASFERQAPTRADHEPVVDAAGDHADPGHPSRAAACPTAALHDLTSAGHSGRGNARTPDTGQRTPGRSDARTGHWTPVAWTGTRGHWSLAPDTGRRTLAEDTDRVTKARPAAGPPGPPRRATARWDAQTVFLWTAPAVPLSPWRLGGEATFQREIALALPCSCLAAPPGPSGASAHCCPET